MLGLLKYLQSLIYPDSCMVTYTARGSDFFWVPKRLSGPGCREKKIPPRCLSQANTWRNPVGHFFKAVKAAGESLVQLFEENASRCRWFPANIFWDLDLD